MRLIRETLGLPPNGFATDARLEEIDLGQWDGLTDGEASARDPALFAARSADKWNVHVPGGENYAEVAARVESWLASLGGDTFAVSHGALTRILRGLIEGLDWKGMADLDETQGVLFRLRDKVLTRIDPI